MPDETRVSDDVVAAGAVANAAAWLKGVRFPAHRDQLVEQARANGADESALDELRALPAERAYDDPGQVFRALGDEVRGL